MDKKVKYLEVQWYHPFQDPITGVQQNVLRTAVHGVTLHSEYWDDEGEDQEDTATDIWGVPESELIRLERANPGCFYGENEAPLERLVDEWPDQTPVAGSPDNGLDTPASGTGNFEPIPLHDRAQWQIVEWMRTEQPTPEQMFRAVNEATDPVVKERLIRNMLSAEVEVTQGEARDEVMAGLKGQLVALGIDPDAEPGASAAPEAFPTTPAVPSGPEALGGGGEGGSAPPAPEETEGGGTPGEGGEVAPTGPQAEIDSAGNPVPSLPTVDVEATDAARALAAELGLDINLVKGSGSDGRVIEPDVRAYHWSVTEGNE